jgi:hypothetical protein
MTGYDRKIVEFSHDAAQTVTFTVEVDVTGDGTWRRYGAFGAAPEKTARHEFPRGYSAYWVRAVADRECRATATFTYE